MGRIIKVRLNHSKRNQALIAQQKQRTMFARIALLFVLLVVFAAALSFGPVWLMADATRMQQETVELRREVDDELTLNQKLMIDVAVLKSSTQLVTIATQQLGMVESPVATTWVSLDEPVVEETPVATVADAGPLSWIARLAVGEASALLVGDVGISALR